MMIRTYLFFFFFFNDTATTEIYTLSLHDALPIYAVCRGIKKSCPLRRRSRAARDTKARAGRRWLVRTGRKARRKSRRSEEHTSELQSQSNLVCRLLLEKKKKTSRHQIHRSADKTQ